jgi:hypothetical protein
MSYGKATSPGSIAYAAAPVSPPPPSDQLLKNVQAGLYEVQARLGHTIGKAKDFADYVVGAQPEEASNSCASPTPYGIGQSLHDGVSVVHSLITALNDQLARLDRL